MKVALVISIFIASCIASPLDPAKTPTSPPGAEHTLHYVDEGPTGPPFFPVDNSLTLVSRDTLPPTCPTGTTYDSSTCFNASFIRGLCVSNRPGGPGVRTGVNCNKNEICVQRNLSNGKPYAKCIDIHQLVSWKTSPDGGKSGCTTVEASPIGSYKLGTIVYDVNKHPIQVSKINYLGEPGDADDGIGGSVSSFSSGLFRFTGSNYMKVCIFSGGAGNLNAYTWLWS
uniref:Secreted in xylem 6 n=1 Tax=Fusarium oxysporum f. sp. sesami TaxID=654397 RepID=A0A6G6A8Q3_FUSOX|nr:secreted in xylem 6 [Fusarium oxysporum f. sp. sesami]